MTYQNRKSDLTQFATKTTFFIVAFIPLWAILIINYAFTENANWYLIAGASEFLVFISVIMAIYLRRLRSVRNGKDGELFFKVMQKSNITHDVIFYTLAYIPVLLLSTFEIREIVTFSIVLFTIYVLYIKTNMIHINPMLALMRYNMYKVTDDHDNTVVLLSKLNVKTGIEVPYEEITNNVYVVLDDEG